MTPKKHIFRGFGAAVNHHSVAASTNLVIFIISNYNTLFLQDTNITENYNAVSHSEEIFFNVSREQTGR